MRVSPIRQKWLVNAWSTLQLLLVAVSFNALSVTQHFGVLIQLPIYMDAGTHSTYQWGPVTFWPWLGIAIALMAVTTELMTSRADRRPPARIPGFFGFPRNVHVHHAASLRNLSIYGSASFCLYVGWHLLRKTTAVSAYCGGNKVASSRLEHFTNYVSPATAFAPGPNCRLDWATNGVTYFPFWEPWLMLIGLIAVTVLWARLLLKNAAN